MTYSIEFIVNTGQFEHSKLTVTADTESDLGVKLDAMTNATAESIGRFATIFKGAVLYGRDNPGDIRSPQQLIEEELGGKVIDATEHQELPAWQRPVESAPKAWEKPVVKEDDGW